MCDTYMHVGLSVDLGQLYCLLYLSVTDGRSLTHIPCVHAHRSVAGFLLSVS